MRLPRNAKVFRGQLDAAPFAGLTFLLLLFILLQSKLVFTPVIPIDLPQVPGDLPGTASPTVVLAVDRSGQIYYESQAVTSLADLRARLRTAVHDSPEPLSLELQIDESATLKTTAPLLSLASELGVRHAWLVTRPKPQPIAKAGRK
jgi:biopolymer transport protein ExbD